MADTPHLNVEDRATLVALNKAVEDAMRARREWLDRKMAELSTFKPGDEVYNAWDGRLLGVVREPYRFLRDQFGGLYDRSLTIDYRFTDGDNTSRHTEHLWLATREEAVRRVRERLKV